MNTITIILISIYIISLLTVRSWFGKAHSKNGIWYSQETDISCIIFTIIPVFNTVVMVSQIFQSPYRESYKPSKNFNKLFGVKK